MTATDRTGLGLTGHYAEQFPELCVPWRAAAVAEPELLAFDEGLAVELGLDPAFLRSPEGLRLLVGTEVSPGSTPVAQAYSGHQFGGYSPRLGDGRALLLGELPDGRDLHLKGSGPTPFARGGDGLAAVGPMLREYLMCAAMDALDVPTTRALAVIGTGATVLRERPLPGAVLVRVASSHLRVGTFQYARSTGDVNLLRRLADHAIRRHHPAAADSERPHLALFSAVVAAQASLVARWSGLGFVHGVMNTDNTTISGETIDYGPCAFMERVDPATVFSSIDTGGRYAFGNQPAVLGWNLARFAETLVPLVDPDPDTAVELLTHVLRRYPGEFEDRVHEVQCAKLGLGTRDADGARALTAELPGLLAAAGADHTSAYRGLADAARGETGPALELLGGGEAGADWLRRWLGHEPSAAAMDRVNPLYIPRNHLVEEALEAATAGELGPFTELLDVVTRPFEGRPGLERYARPAPADAPPHVTYCGT